MMMKNEEYKERIKMLLRAVEYIFDEDSEENLEKLEEIIKIRKQHIKQESEVEE